MHGAGDADHDGLCSAVGSRAANQEGAVGFVNSANDVTAFLFGQAHGAGTMPHALVGYAGSTIRAAEIYHDRYPQEKMTVLVDYFAQEVTDTIALCQRFPRLAEKGISASGWTHMALS